jgi:hypothetical protein
MDIETLRHVGSFVTLDRRAVIPYLFSGGRGDRRSDEPARLTVPSLPLF